MEQYNEEVSKPSIKEGILVTLGMLFLCSVEGLVEMFLQFIGV